MWFWPSQNESYVKVAIISFNLVSVHCVFMGETNRLSLRLNRRSSEFEVLLWSAEAASQVWLTLGKPLTVSSQNSPENQEKMRLAQT